ncbi:uncharacterized protein [Hyperolius riggenbachi]|uniref:uncharacterized protein n=1 Tax=Hyperolius riggenbachi TaxID=752182 RepID=UPI0035A370E6
MRLFLIASLCDACEAAGRTVNEVRGQATQLPGSMLGPSTAMEQEHFQQAFHQQKLEEEQQPEEEQGEEEEQLEEESQPEEEQLEPLPSTTGEMTGKKMTFVQPPLSPDLHQPVAVGVLDVSPLQASHHHTPSRHDRYV